MNVQVNHFQMNDLAIYNIKTCFEREAIWNLEVAQLTAEHLYAWLNIFIGCQSFMDRHSNLINLRNFHYVNL